MTSADKYCILIENMTLKDDFPSEASAENLFIKTLYNIYVFHFCKCFYRKFKQTEIYFPLFSFKRIFMAINAGNFLEKILYLEYNGK